MPVWRSPSRLEAPPNQTCDEIIGEHREHVDGECDEAPGRARHEVGRHAAQGTLDHHSHEALRRRWEQTNRSVPVKTKITELPDSRVRVDAEVPSEEVESTLQKTAAALGK